MSNTNRAYFSVQRIFKKKVIFPKTKVRIYKILIEPVLIYGSQKWTLNKKIVGNPSNIRGERTIKYLLIMGFGA